MKKTFIIIAICLSVFIITLLVATNFIFIGEKVTDKTPSSINIYKKSIAILNNKQYKNEDEEFNVLLEKIAKAGETNLFERLINGLGFENKLEQAEDNQYSTSISDIRTSNICIELIFDTKQDKIIYFGKNTKVITYNKLLFVFAENGNKVGNILIYYEDGSNSYSNHNPLIITGKTGDMISYVNGIK